MTDETDTNEINETPLAKSPETPEQPIEVHPPGLDQFTYSIRHRPEFVNKPFANGNFEGRMKLGTHEYIVSATTLDDLVTKMTVKADSLLANGYKVQG